MLSPYRTSGSTYGRNKMLIVVGVAVLFTVALSPTAHADPDLPVFPSQSEVDAAQQRVVSAERSVSEIQADLAAASQQLEELAVAAEQAAEAYNGALLQWDRANQAVTVAAERAERAAEQASQARDILAGFVVSDSNSGSTLLSFSSAMTASGQHRLIAEVSQSDTSSRGSTPTTRLGGPPMSSPRSTRPMPSLR
ncbi:MAG: hypothetical protein WKF73_14265 [Nocardioidaceae bacterium]